MHAITLQPFKSYQTTIFHSLNLIDYIASSFQAPVKFDKTKRSKSFSIYFNGQYIKLEDSRTIYQRVHWT